MLLPLGITSSVMRINTLEAIPRCSAIQLSTRPAGLNMESSRERQHAHRIPYLCFPYYWCDISGFISSLILLSSVHLSDFQLLLQPLYFLRFFLCYLCCFDERCHYFSNSQLCGAIFSGAIFTDYTGHHQCCFELECNFFQRFQRTTTSL